MDVSGSAQMMAGHASLQMTQTYTEGDSKIRSKMAGLLRVVSPFFGVS